MHASGYTYGSIRLHIRIHRIAHTYVCINFRNNALFYKHVPEEEVFRLCFRFATKEDNPQEVQTLSATQLFERMKAAHPSVMRGMTEGWAVFYPNWANGCIPLRGMCTGWWNAKHLGSTYAYIKVFKAD